MGTCPTCNHRTRRWRRLVCSTYPTIVFMAVLMSIYFFVDNLRINIYHKEATKLLLVCICLALMAFFCLYLLYGLFRILCIRMRTRLAVRREAERRRAERMEGVAWGQETRGTEDVEMTAPSLPPPVAMAPSTVT
ncbi:hypothetical protein B9Z65_6330 [Elsinoe australis]|uniref:Uncharacterized protein n=1 Tax=Elsinoe australis TaxID=40998 RepID=A0A2P8A8B7_9PEZI|nr:hypothetical protein B9Z65_6330 [Elsinoe australis]